MRILLNELNKIVCHWDDGDNRFPEEAIEVEKPENFDLHPFDYFYIDGRFILDEEAIQDRDNLIHIYETIEEDKNNLSATDYKIIKLAEQLFQIKEIREMLNMDNNSIDELQEVINQRKSWRAEINNLEEN